MTETELTSATQSNIPQGWKTAPSLEELKQNFDDSKSYHDEKESDRINSLDHLNIQGGVKLPKRKGFSTVQPKLIRKHAEWRYAALSEAFLSTDDIYDLKPATCQDKMSAQQNEAVLNYQWNNEINKVLFVDTLVRTDVDEGTVFVRAGWESETREVEKEVPIYDFIPAQSQEQVQQPA